MSTLSLSGNVPTGVHGALFENRLVACADLTDHRMGFARLAETSIRKIKGKSETDSLGAMDKILASTIGGALATWNQPIEVVRVEVCTFGFNSYLSGSHVLAKMQSMAKNATANVNRPAKLTVMNTLAFIYKENGIKGLYRGVTPRIGLGIWQTICMVSFADYVKIWSVHIFYGFLSVLIPPSGSRASSRHGQIPHRRITTLNVMQMHRIPNLTTYCTHTHLVLSVQYEEMILHWQA